MSGVGTWNYCSDLYWKLMKHHDKPDQNPDKWVKAFERTFHCDSFVDLSILRGYAKDKRKNDFRCDSKSLFLNFRDPVYSNICGVSTVLNVRKMIYDMTK